MSAPAELVQMGLDAAHFRRVSANEYHGPCPMCGGSDRFRVHTDKPWPHWYCVCREGTGCGWQGWADQLAPNLRTADTEALRTAWIAEREAERKRRQARLDEFSASELWEAYARKMSDDHRAWWRAQGITDGGQDYWRLGWTARAPISGSPEAYTIPYFDAHHHPINMQYRLANVTGADKYRWAGLGYSSFFTAHPDMTGQEVCLVCEGAKKAMVSALWLGEAFGQVYAVPSKSDHASLPAQLADYGRVWIVFDPDGLSEAHKLAAAVGKAARVFELPGKIDDVILNTQSTKIIHSAMRYARRANQKGQ